MVLERRVWTDQRGLLRFSPAQRRRLGLTPDTGFLVEETSDGFVLRRADPALAKLIVEPTSACNLSCRTCVRHSCDEPMGSMSMATYRALIAGLREVPTLRTIAFWGIGEPLVHPDIVEMVRLAHELGARTEMVTNGLLLDEQMAERLVLDFDFPPCTDCGACEPAETNESDCFGNPFPVCGDCLWAKGVIQCP